MTICDDEFLLHCCNFYNNLYIFFDIHKCIENEIFIVWGVESNQCLHFGSKYFTNGLRIDSLSFVDKTNTFDRVSEKGVNNTDCDAFCMFGGLRKKIHIWFIDTVMNLKEHIDRSLKLIKINWICSFLREIKVKEN